MKEKGKSPAFQFYPNDFILDDKVKCMPNEAIGMYVKLLCYDWINDGLPDDKKALMRMADFDWTDFQGGQRESEDWDIICSHVYGSFMAHPSKKGRLTNPRLYKERVKQREFSEERSKSGKKGATKKWGKLGDKMKKQPDGSAIKEPMAEPMAEHMAKNGSSSSSSNTKKISKDIQKVEQSSPTPSQIARKFFSTDESKERIIAELTASGCPIELARVEIVKFVDYWTEPNKSGSKVRWETERTFEIGRRLKNWFRNYNKFNPAQNEYIA